MIKREILINSNTGNEEKLEIFPLGGGCEVGRSCIVLKFQGLTIMLDCGIHPCDNDYSSLPFFDKINPEEIDLLLITHFHLDHCGALPYFLEKTNFKGKTYMTFPTKAIYKQLLLDSLKVGQSNNEKSLFTKEDIISTMSKIIAINFHEEFEHKNIKFTAYNAGHVIGACMFLININRTKILYTGDYSREEDIHIRPAEIPNSQIDVLIVESTYGVKTNEPREKRESYFLETVEKIVKRNGKCLLPVFVLGRAQELLLLLEEFWSKKSELHDIPIYYASTLMAKCMQIFQMYMNMMGKTIQEKMKAGINPFDFKFISMMKNSDNVDSSERSMVVMASPGMLQKGLSRSLFQKWCHDERNGILFTGYCVENTLARDILNGKKEFKKDNGQIGSIKITVEYVSFSAHADYEQTKCFIEKLKPKLVVLVHGEKHEAFRLKKELENNFGNSIRFEAPSNWQTVEMMFEKKIQCNLFDRYSNEYNKQEIINVDGELMDSTNLEFYVEIDHSAILFKKDSKFYVSDENNLNNLTNLKPGKLMQKIQLEFKHSFELALFLLQQILPNIAYKEIDKITYIVIKNSVFISQINSNMILVEWEVSEQTDIIADCVCYFLNKLSSYENIDMFREDPYLNPKDSLEILISKNFDNVEVVRNNDDIVTLKSRDFTLAEINIKSKEIKNCNDDFIRDRLINLLDNYI